MYKWSYCICVCVASRALKMLTSVAQSDCRFAAKRLVMYESVSSDAPSVIVFAGTLGEIEGRVLGVGEAPLVRHGTDREEISQGEETHSRVSAQVCTRSHRKT